MTEYWFYHLEASPLEAVLPDLLEKTRTRGWRALVCLPESRLSDMDTFLWTYQDASFLPHGRDDEPQSDQQPIMLSSTAKTSAGIDCVFLIDGAELDIDEKTERCIVMINGRSESDVQQSRQLWKRLKDKGENLSYWQQTERGGWEKKA